MEIGPLVIKFCHLALGGPVIMTHRVVWNKTPNNLPQSSCSVSPTAVVSEYI